MYVHALIVACILSNFSLTERTLSLSHWMDTAKDDSRNYKVNFPWSHHRKQKVSQSTCMISSCVLTAFCTSFFTVVGSSPRCSHLPKISWRLSIAVVLVLRFHQSAGFADVHEMLTEELAQNLRYAIVHPFLLRGQMSSNMESV